MSSEKRYFIRVPTIEGPRELEVSKLQFIAFEQDAGFNSKFEGEPATGGFSHGCMVGLVR